MRKGMVQVALCFALAGTLGSAGQTGPTVRYKKPAVSGRSVLSEAQTSAAWQHYRASIARACPRQKLQLQSPEGMNLHVQAFQRMMSPPQVKRYREFVADACELTQPTAACANTALLAAADEGKYLDRFVANECDTGTRCTAQGKCSVPYAR